MTETNTLKCRVLPLLLSLFFLFSLTACGNNSTSAGKAAVQSSDTEKTETVAENTEAETLPAEETRWLLVKEETTKNGEFFRSYENTYNEYGNLIQSSFTNQNGSFFTTVYTYDDRQVRNGGSSTDHRVSINAVTDTVSTYYYDEYGNMSMKHEESFTDFDDDQPYEDLKRTEDITYFYDALGNKMGQVSGQNGTTWMWADVYSYGEPEDQSGKTYNEAGLLIRYEHSNVIEEYEYDANGNRIHEKTTSHPGEQTESVLDTVYTYEERVCKTTESVLPPTKELEVVYQALTTAADGSCASNYYYAYDKYGRQVCAFDMQNSRHEYNEYDEAGNVIRVWTDDFVADMIYDENGNRIREDFRKMIGGEVVISSECEYNEKGQVIRAVTHAHDSDYEKVDGAYQEYEYAENGEVSVCRYYDAAGTLQNYEERTYNADNTLASHAYYDGNGNLLSTTEAVYTTITVIAEE